LVPLGRERRRSAGCDAEGSSTEPRIEYFRREGDGWKIHDLRGQGTLRST
jgi:hypothetical protein